MLDALFSMTKVSLRRTYGIKYSTKELRSLLKIAKEDLEIFGEPRGTSMNSMYTKEEVSYLQVRWMKNTLTNAYSTPYYHKKIEPSVLKNFSLNRIEELPITTKSDIRKHSTEFVNKEISSDIFLYQSTSGTTGSPTEMYFTRYELEVFNLFGAINGLIRGVVLPGDILQFNHPLGAQIVAVSTYYLAHNIGAVAMMQGQVHPKDAVLSLIKERNISRERKKVSVLIALPSYIERLMEASKTLGYTCEDFDLRYIQFFGEVMTEETKNLISEFFDTKVIGGYGTSETFPCQAIQCDNGNYHFDESMGYIELLDTKTKEPSVDGAIGVLVITPLYPYREATPVIRYWTGDMAIKIDTCNCGITENGGVYKLLGREAFSVDFNGQIYTHLDFLVTFSPIKDELAIPIRYGAYVNNDKLILNIQSIKSANTTKLKDKISSRINEMGISKVEVNIFRDMGFEHFPIRSENIVEIKRGELQWENCIESSQEGR